MIHTKESVTSILPLFYRYFILKLYCHTYLYYYKHVFIQQMNGLLQNNSHFLTNEKCCYITKVVEDEKKCFRKV